MPMKILVADDSAPNRAIFAALIQQMGHTVSPVAAPW